MKKNTWMWGLLLCLAAFHASAQKKLSVDDIYRNASLRARSVDNVNWMKDGRYYTARKDNDIIRYDVTTGQPVETILAGNSLNISYDNYEFSADERKLLLTTDFEPIYRRSYKAEFYVYDLAAKSLAQLSTGGKQSYATFSPDGSKVAFTRNNNLFFKDLASGKETAVTTTGKFNELIHGSADWVYEEEFSMAKAFEWSPDGSKIAFISFNESNVPEFNMQMWLTNALYPTDYRFKYPKAGESNSIVSVSVYDLASGATTAVNIGEETDIYVPRIQWTSIPNTLAVLRMNRLQNKMELLYADVTTGATRVILEENSKTYLEAENFDMMVYLKNGKQFIWASEQSGYKHLYLYNNDGKLVRPLTQGDWEVDKFLGIDETAKVPVIYYTSTEVSPLERHFYRIGLDGKNKQRLTASAGSNRINLSHDFKYYFCYNTSNQVAPNVKLYQVNGNKLVKVLEENTELQKAAADFRLSQKEFFTFKTADGTVLNGYFIKPPDFDATKRYPVLMHVYGGPGSQQVLNTYANGTNDLWHNMLAQNGYLVACVDNRGTGARGEAFKKITYANLGKYEVADQIEAAKYLGSLPYVDKERIGIWGWSYGGYMSSLCLLLGNDVFKAAIAVAPVTNWRFYDTIYTERFLQRPQDNPSGYDDYSPVTHANKLKGKLLLVHGTGDDNVHFQNAVALQNALIAANKQFDSFYYPDRNHGIYGGITRIHLYQMMTDFVLKNL
ncbi:S9 family peptidase [Rhodoflexus sp.]